MSAAMKTVQSIEAPTIDEAEALIRRVVESCRPVENKIVDSYVGEMIPVAEYDAMVEMVKRFDAVSPSPLRVRG